MDIDVALEHLRELGLHVAIDVAHLGETPAPRVGGARRRETRSAISAILWNRSTSPVPTSRRTEVLTEPLLVQRASAIWVIDCVGGR